VAEVRLLACDVCGKHEGMTGVKIEKVTLEVGGIRARGVLCQDDAKPVVDVIRKLPGRRGSSRHDFESSMVDDPSQIPQDGAQSP